MTAQDIRASILSAIQRADLLDQVDQRLTQIVDLMGDLFVEVVLISADEEERISSVVESVLEEKAQQAVSLVVRSHWTIKLIGNPLPAYGPDGGIRAAVLIPVTLKSGRVQCDVTVAVTKLAEMELDRILGRKTPMGEVAQIVIGNALRRGGQSSWNPRAESYFEVGSSAAPQLSRFLKKVA